MKSARASQRKEKTGPLLTPGDVTMPTLVVYTSCTIANVHAWQNEIRTRRDDKNRLVLNDSQFAVAANVASIICEEMQPVDAGNFKAMSEPLRWSMHGGPGTGKSHVINIMKDSYFEKVLTCTIRT